MNISIMSKNARQTFSQMISDMSNFQKTVLQKLAKEISSKAPRWSNSADFTAPASNVERLIAKELPDISTEERTILKRSLVAKFALDVPVNALQMNLPESFLSYYSPTMDRLANHLKSDVTSLYPTGDDFFCKDIRLVLHLSIPCGAQDVDLISYVPLKSAIGSVFRSKSTNALVRYVGASGGGIWFRIHTDTRYLSEFDEPGWDRCYRRIAELLVRRRHIRGVVGTSWFFDPQLLEISPRHAFLQQRPLEGGAFNLRHGTDEIDIEQSTRTSPTRRRLYQEGTYVPVCYSLLWPRKYLISWAEMDE